MGQANLKYCKNSNVVSEFILSVLAIKAHCDERDGVGLVWVFSLPMLFVMSDVMVESLSMLFYQLCANVAY